MNDYYQHGMDANADGLFRTQCPHAESSEARSQWLRGWDDFQPIREELEAGLYARARLYAA